MMRTPRNILVGTRAEGQLRREFWTRYVSARVRGGDNTPFGSAQEIFEQALLDIMQTTLSETALTTPVLFTEQLSNHVLAVCLQIQDRGCIIAVNARFKFDPEVMAHTLIEEFAHVQQIWSRVDFQAQRQQFAYRDRPYEKEAKQIAVDILGYELENFTAILLREEPEGILFDHVKILDEKGE